MATPLLQVQDLHAFYGKSHILHGVTFDIAAGEIVSMLGRNGVGKSTLFNLISGRFPISSGSIRLEDEEISGLKSYEINRRGLSRSFQVTNIFPRLSVYENIRCAVLWSLGYKYSFWRGVNALADARERSEDIMERIGLAGRRRDQAGVLTYAEQRALEIGVTIAGGARVILLDEPMAGMSRSETEHAVALVRKVTEGKTLLMVEHDMGVVFGIADRISVLVYGKIIASDTPQRIRENAAVKEAYLGEAAH
jgi:branched-chain amino acid transport system ATP-binding protein